MDKLECLKKYMIGNLIFFNYLLDQINNVEQQQALLEEPELIKAAKVGMITLLLLSIKEELIDLDNQIYFNKVLDKDIKDAVDQIRNKCNALTNISFSNDGEIINFIRKKLAHGHFCINFKGNKVVLDNDGEDLILNINALALYTILLSKAYLRAVNGANYEKELHFTTIHQNERIKSKYDVMKLLDSIQTVKVSLKKNDNAKIKEEAYNIVNNALYNFKQTNDYTFFDECSKTIKQRFGNDYTFSYEIKPLELDSEFKKEFAESMAININNCQLENRHNIIHAIDFSLTNYLRRTNTPFNACMGAQVNLIVLEGINKTKSINRDVLDKFFAETYNDAICINTTSLAVSLISVFESSFAYGKDDCLADLDYTIFDFSSITPNYIDLTDIELNEVNVQINSLRRSLMDCNNNYHKLQEQLSRINPSNQKGVSAITNNINLCQTTINTINTKLTELNNRVIELNGTDHQKFIYNKAIIDGIRNSISHGHYEIRDGYNLPESRIVFNDIYEGQLTFSLDISFEEFYQLLLKNVAILIEEIDNSKELKKVLV